MALFHCHDTAMVHSINLISCQARSKFGNLLISGFGKGGGGFFERVRKVQTTLTRIFIVLESVSHGLSENWDGISRKARKFKRFFRLKTGGLQKKKKVFTEIETDFSAKIGNSNAFSYRITSSTSQLRHPITFGGGLFSIFYQKSASKAPKTCDFAYFTSQWGELEPPPPRPPSGCATVSC